MLLLAAGVGAAYQARAADGDAGLTARSAAATPTFSNVRVCGTDTIPFKGHACRRDLRGTGLVFREIDCSVRVSVQKRSPFTASISYQGSLQYIAHTVLKPGKHNELVGVRVNPAKMPGGHYACVFKLGAKKTKIEFRTNGPSARFLGSTVCITPARRNAFCRADAAGSAIPSPRSLMCGGVFVGFQGKTWGVKLVRLTKTGPALVGQYGAKNLPAPISEKWVSFKARTAVNKFRPAKYSCLFFANKQLIAEKNFTVKAA